MVARVHETVTRAQYSPPQSCLAVSAPPPARRLTELWVGRVARHSDEIDTVYEQTTGGVSCCSVLSTLNYVNMGLVDPLVS